MKFHAWAVSDKGLRRDSNQDSFLIDTELGLFIVADGMGGHSGGEVASALAVQSAQEFIKNDFNESISNRDLLSRAYSHACLKIYEKAADHNLELAGMGTTMVMILIRNGMLSMANVGDSRGYFYKKPFFWQVTEDHSLVYEQLRSGIITEDQLEGFVGKNVITRSVGFERRVETDVVERSLQADEKYLLCSDGLTGMVNDHDICEIINRNKSSAVAQACVDAALKNGGEDNVTVLFLEIQ